MNAPVRPAAAPTRYRFTLDQVRELWALGAFPGDPNLELIDGELIEMPADGAVTRTWNARLHKWLFRKLQDQPVVIIVDKTLDLGRYAGPKPDVYIYPSGLDDASVRGGDVLLTIEVSDTTLDYDLKIKPDIYAAGGVRELWVIDVNAPAIHRHRLQPEGGYGAPEVIEADQPCAAGLIDGLALTLSALPPL